LEDFYSFIKEEDEDGSIFYHFITPKNFVYTVYFKVDEYSVYVNDFPLLLQSGYAFGFKKSFINKERVKNSLDFKVFDTLYQIILDFISDNGDDTVLLYHCDTSDEKQLYRSRLFDKWEKRIKDSHLERHCVEVCIDNKDFYLGFITPSKNPNIESLNSEFESFSYFIIQPKF